MGRATVFFSLAAVAAFFLLSLLAPRSWSQPKPAPAEEAALTKARQTADLLTEKLKALLSQELAAGGFAGAVDACSRSAQAATAELARQQGVQLRRVSVRYRNQADIPDAWEKRRLEKFAAQKEAGALPPELHEIVATSAGGKQLRYLRPIVLQPMCVSCHGAPSQIPADVSKLISAKYPHDLATGFRPGDLRGAISVTVPLP